MIVIVVIITAVGLLLLGLRLMGAVFDKKVVTDRGCFCYIGLALRLMGAVFIT